MKFSSQLLFVILLLLGSCKSKVAYNYSQEIAAMESSLTPAIHNTETQVAKFAKEENWDSVKAVSERMEGLIEAKLQKIKGDPAPAVPQGEEFKNASLNYFKFMSGIYESYRDVAIQSTPEGRQETAGKMMSMLNDKNKVLADMQAAQREFAKANGFKIESKKD